MSFINKATCSLARVSANRPIHVIIVGALLASLAYLAVVDEYVPQLFSTNSSITYYHPPGNTEFKHWSIINNPENYPDAAKVSLLPLRFSRLHNNDLPEVENSLPGVISNERVFILNPDEVTETVQSLDGLSYNGITWKIRNSSRLSHIYDYLRFAITRVQSLIQGAENFDVILILVAYIVMLRTLIGVFFDMKKAGSNFWLAFSTLTSSTFAFLFALVTTTHFLNFKVSFISMSEGIPFLVAIIGFKHKVSIATFVLRESSSDLDVKTIISNAISAHHVSMLRDHFTVVAPLLIISLYAQHLEGLRNFSVLAVLILTYDLLMVYTFFSAILALKVEINRARRTENLKRALEEDGVSSWIANNVASASTIKVKKEESLLDFKNTSILSFKFAMVAGFFGFHAFWFGSSWLFDVAIERRSESGVYQLTKSIAKHIDIGSKGTLVTVIKPKLYVPLGLTVKLEDAVTGILGFISAAIKDSILSKLILFSLTVSICINAYFLNASRHQVSATRQLIQKQISKPKSQKSKSNKLHDSSDDASKDEDLIDSDTDDTSDDEQLEIMATKTIRPLGECVKFLQDGRVKDLTNSEVSSLVVGGKLPLYALEKQLSDNKRAVEVRRKAISKIANAPVLDTKKLPYEKYDYDRVFGACCENVIGFMPIPVGIAGPLIIDGKPYHIPMATTEGCLVASAMRGCKAINAGGGVQTVLTQDGMTRGPCVSFPSLARAGAAKIWIDSEEGQKVIKKAFNSTSRFARLQHIQTALAGTLLFIRFRTTTGDAMGMNMISKGVEHCLKFMVEECGWEDMDIISVSGNYCIDKKPAAINWIEGRGKSVVAEARIPSDVVRKVLKSEVKALVELNIDKNLIGSAMAGSVGGFNAHAANLVTAVFLACGQDPAQNVESSNCITLMKEGDGGDLQISVSMPSIEVGTIGGGTILEPQGAMLELLGVRGPHPTNPGDNARQLARIVASIVLAAELSLCSALAAGHLVQSHMQHNRKGAAPSTTPDPNSNGALKGADDVKRLQEGAVNCIRS